jgi:hypothetical protein
VHPYLRERLESCEADLRAHLDPDEHLVAVGRCEDVTDRGGVDQGGAGWTFVMVTDRHLRWVPGVSLRFETAVDLDDVTDASEQISAHRYAMTMHHAPVRALRQVPAHRFMTFRWGNAIALLTLSRTRLAFSRRDTEAARALREQLARRGIVAKVVPGPPRHPRPGPNYYVLRRRDGQ